MLAGELRGGSLRSQKRSLSINSVDLLLVRAFPGILVSSWPIMLSIQRLRNFILSPSPSAQSPRYRCSSSPLSSRFRKLMKQPRVLARSGSMPGSITHVSSIRASPTADCCFMEQTSQQMLAAKGFQKRVSSTSMSQSAWEK